MNLLSGFLIFIMLIFTKVVFASSCCGSGQATSSLILSEQKLLLNASLTSLDTLGRIYESKDFFVFDKDKKRINKSLSFSASYAFDQKNQIGLLTSFLFSSYKDEFGKQSDEAFGDININYARKFKLKKIDYFFNIGLVLPSGKSVFNQNLLSENTNVSGFGQTASQIGLTIHKVKYPFTLLSELRYFKYFSDVIGEDKVSGFDFLNASVFIGYSLNWGLSLGSGVSLIFENGRSVNDFKTKASRLFSFNFIVSKAISEKSSLALNISDQTLISGAKNSLLGRSVGLNFIHSIF